MPRLPVPGADADSWGTILNEFLRVSHNEQGGLKGTLPVANAADFGAVCDGVADDQPAIQAAINSLPNNGGTVIIPFGMHGDCRLESSLSINRIGVRLMGVSTGRIATKPKLTWHGPAGGTMLYVQNGSLGTAVETLLFDGNNQAGVCVHIEAVAGSANHDAYLSRLHFQAYQRYGLVLGVLDETTLHNGQLRVVTAENLVFQGGVAGASGVLLNAQNAEFVNFYSPYFDPVPGGEHERHIYQYAGGIQLFGMASTRSTLCAIESRGQLGVYGWRSEDRYLVKQHAVDPSGPSLFQNVHQRFIGTNQPTDNTFDINHAFAPQTLSSVRIQGSIHVGSTTARHLNAQGVLFELPGAGYRLTGPQKQRGIFHDAAIGAWMLRGTAPSLDFRDETGGAVAGMITGLKGLSATETKSKNLRGNVTVSGNLMTASVTFNEPEADNLYYVFVSVDGGVGNVPTLAKLITVKNKQAAGFELQLEAAPGENNTVSIVWLIVR